MKIKCNIGISKIHGVGVFAINDIKKGEELFNPIITRIEMSLQEFNSLDENTKKVILDRNVIYAYENIVFINPDAEINYPSFMNHSDNPNSNGYIALKNIKAGEEITENYRHGLMHELSKKHFTFL